MLKKYLGYFFSKGGTFYSISENLCINSRFPIIVRNFAEKKLICQSIEVKALLI